MVKLFVRTILYTEKYVPHVAPGYGLRQGAVGRHLHHLSLLQQLEHYNTSVPSLSNDR